MTAVAPLATIPLASGSASSASAAGITVNPAACFGLTTAGDVIRRALLLILVESGDSELEADEYADGLAALNDYMATIEAEGTCLGYTRCCNVADIVTVPDGALQGIASNLAIILSPMFSGVLTPAVIAQAETGRKAMRRLGRKPFRTQLPNNLPLGAGNSDHYAAEQFYTPTAAATLSMGGNRRPTEMRSASAAEKAQGHWSIDENKGLTVDIGGRIANFNDESVTLTVSATFTITGNTTSGVVGFARNGVMCLYGSDAFLATPTTFSLTGTITLETGQYIDVVVGDLVTTEDITLTDALVRLT